MADPEKKGSLEEFKASLPAQFSDDGQSDPGEGGGDDAEDGGLDEDIEKAPGSDADDTEADGGDEDDEADDDLDADDEDDEPEPAAVDAKKPKPGAEDDALLDGEKLTKLSGGEYVSKKSFLKRLKRETEGRKAIQAQLDAAKPLLERKADFEAFEKNRPAIEAQNAYINSLRPVLTQEPWLAQMLKDRMSGKPTNYAELVQHLKPSLAPFWDGVEVVEADPQEQALLIARQTQERVRRWEEDQKKSQQQQQESARAQEREAKHITTFKAQEKNVWTKYAAYAKEPFYKNRLFDAAEAEQASLPEGQTVDLEKVADRVFGELAEVEGRRRQERQAARDRAKKAGGERSNGIPGIPVKRPDPKEKPVDARQAVKAGILADFGARFKN